MKSLWNNGLSKTRNQQWENWSLSKLRIRWVIFRPTVIAALGPNQSPAHTVTPRNNKNTWRTKENTSRAFQFFNFFPDIPRSIMNSYLWWKSTNIILKLRNSWFKILHSQIVKIRITCLAAINRTMKCSNIVSVRMFFSVWWICKSFWAAGKFTRKRLFSRVNSHVNAHIFYSSESFSTFSVNT